jgi:hypothetical protein
LRNIAVEEVVMAENSVLSDTMRDIRKAFFHVDKLPRK